MSDTTVTVAPAAPKGGMLRVWLVAFGLALALYASTANRGVQWQDSGWQQWRIVSGHFENPLGLALTHPVQYFLGRCAINLPSVEPAFAITLVSSLAAAIAIANLVTLVRLLTGQTATAAVAGGAVALAHTVWHLATHTESYTLVAALLTTEWLCLAQFARTRHGRWLVLLALLNGLGVSNHVLAGLATPVDIGVILWAMWRKHLNIRAGSACLLAWLIGALPYITLILVAARTDGLMASVHSALFGKYAGDVLNTSINVKSLTLAVGYLAYNFPNFTVPLALWGLFARGVAPPALRWALVAELLIYFAFAARYSVPDQFMFFLPMYPLVGLFCGLGLADLRWRWAQRSRLLQVAMVATVVTVLWDPLVYVATSRVVEARGLLRSMVGNKPYRDGYQAFFVPWGVGRDHVVRVNEQALRLADPDGLILVSDSMMQFAFSYEVVLGRVPAGLAIEVCRPTHDKPFVLEDRRAQLAAAWQSGRTVVLVPRDRDKPDIGVEDALWRRDGDLYVLDGFATPQSAPAGSAP
ncbi:MAG: DUF2723 domain-containing protein [Phycisphaerae bacterium]|nr:DUF2723 domain-containing protein [Phycisphaerae bacterium]